MLTAFEFLKVAFELLVSIVEAVFEILKNT